MNVDVEAVAATVERDGIAIMREVMAPDLLCRIRVRLDELNREEREAGTAFLESEGANQRVFNLVNKGELFEEIVQFPPVVEVVRRLRGVRPFLRVQENRLVSVRPQGMGAGERHSTPSAGRRPLSQRCRFHRRTSAQDAQAGLPTQEARSVGVRADWRESQRP